MLRSAVLMKWLQGLKLSPRWRDVVVQVVSALLASVGEERYEAMEIGHKSAHGQLREVGILEVQHGGVGVLGDSPKYFVLGIGPHIKLPIGACGLLRGTFDHHPLNH